jgi:hypothetical protein
MRNARLDEKFPSQWAADSLAERGFASILCSQQCKASEKGPKPASAKAFSSEINSMSTLISGRE